MFSSELGKHVCMLFFTLILSILLLLFRKRRQNKPVNIDMLYVKHTSPSLTSVCSEGSTSSEHKAIGVYV